MSVNLAIIGGDLRTIKLAKMLAKEGNEIHTYGLEKAEELKESKNIIFCEKLSYAMEASQVVIGPIPFSSNGKEINSPFSEAKIKIQDLIDNSQSKMLIAGSISSDTVELAKQTEVELIDIMKREELAIRNAISTAEGTIEIAIANTDKIIQGNQILILGFGRIAKVLAKKMEALSAEVTCAARKNEDMAWIDAYGYKAININTLGRDLEKYDMIINTVPHLIMTSERLQYVKQNCLLIDLASKPGGMDERAIQKRGLKFIWALALPGKVAPLTTAEFIKDTIHSILKENEVI